MSDLTEPEARRVMTEGLTDKMWCTSCGLTGAQYAAGESVAGLLANYCGDAHSWVVPVEAVTQAIDAALDRLAAKYPTDVFPDDGESPDAKAARMARITVANVRQALAALFSPFEEGQTE